MLDKTFSPRESEPRLYAGWERSGAFAADPASAARPFTIMIPPPNVTGSLHMGHALTFTVQDVLVRWRRMQGRDVLWQPGTDHAGIATQSVVERLLAAEGNQDRRSMGREAFIARVWQWKAESGGTITRQLRRLGASLDWARERFTLDEGLSAAVRETFVAFAREGADLSRAAAGELGPGVADRDFRPGGGEPGAAREPVAYPLSDRGRGGAVCHRRDDAAGDDAGRCRGRGASRGCAISGPDRAARHSSDCRRCRSRSWPTNTPTPRRGRVR